MKSTTAFAALVALLTHADALAQRCPPVCNVVVPLTRAYELRIVNIEPAAVIEHQDITIEYELGVTKFGVGGELKPQSGMVCGSNHRGTCKSIRSLDPSQTYRGTIQTTAPAAAKDAVIRIVLEGPPDCPFGAECFNNELLAEGSITRAVAADYVVTIDSFKINKTRAVHEDTVLVDLRAMVPGQRSSEPGACGIVGPPTYCVVGVKQGNHNDGLHEAKNVAAGPFRLVPEVEGELAFEYNLLNFGTPYEQEVAKKIFNGISDAASAFMSAYTGNSGWSQANDFTKKINELQFGGCDGPVAIDAKVLRNTALPGGDTSTLDARTRDTGRYSETGGTYEIKSQDGCGKSPRYDVTWSVVRTSWRPWP